jgi:hypothetical protein
MKPKLSFSKLPTILLSAIIMCTACQKSAVKGVSSSDNAAKNEKMNATNNALEASGSDDENFDMIMGYDSYADVSEFASNATANTLSNAKTKTGKIVTYSPSKDVYPHTKTIDYGAGWTDADGVTYSGKIIIIYFDPKADAEGKFTYTTYDNYYVNAVQHQGNVQVNKIQNGNGQTVFLNIVNKTLSTADGDVKDYHTTSKWTLIDFQGGTQNAYEIDQKTTGSETYNGVESNNFKIYSDDANPVIKLINYKRRVQGGSVAQIHLVHVEKGDPNDLDEYLDYGNGERDNIATLSVNGSEPEIVLLPLQFWPLKL